MGLQTFGLVIANWSSSRALVLLLRIYLVNPPPLRCEVALFTLDEA
jgi:hypothetical protein